jgi:hypothetical protein
MTPPSDRLPRRQTDQLGHAGHRRARIELHHPQGRDLRIDPRHHMPGPNGWYCASLLEAQGKCVDFLPFCRWDLSGLR